MLLFSYLFFHHNSTDVSVTLTGCMILTGTKYGVINFFMLLELKELGSKLVAVVNKLIPANTSPR